MDYNTIRSAVRGALSERERAPTPRGRIIDPDEARRDADRRRNCERARGQLRAAEERHRLIERELTQAQQKLERLRSRSPLGLFNRSEIAEAERDLQALFALSAHVYDTEIGPLRCMVRDLCGESHLY